MRFDTYTYDLRMQGGWLPPLANATNPPSTLVQTVTGAAPPTITATAGGIAMALTSASQAQALQVNFGDKLSWDIAKLCYVGIDAYISVALSAAEVNVFLGVGSAMNAAYGSMTALAGFSCTHTGNWFCETDDNVNDKSADTGILPSTVAVPRTFWIDMYSGQVCATPPAASRGGKGSVRFFMDDSGLAPNRGNRRNVCLSTDFNMENYADGTGLQPIIQIAKASGTGVGTLVVSRLRAILREP